MRPARQPAAPQTAPPAGFVYEPEFLGREEETFLLRTVESLPLQEVHNRAWQAKRRIVSYGGRHDFTHRALSEALPIPDFLVPLRDRVARWAGIDPASIHHARLQLRRYPSEHGAWAALDARLGRLV